MVPPKVMTELRKSYDAVRRSTIDPHDYEGPLFDLVFDLITTETFLAGSASKVIDGDLAIPQRRRSRKETSLNRGSVVALRKRADC